MPRRGSWGMRVSLRTPPGGEVGVVGSGDSDKESVEPALEVFGLGGERIGAAHDGGLEQTTFKEPAEVDLVGQTSGAEGNDAGFGGAQLAGLRLREQRGSHERDDNVLAGRLADEFEEISRRRLHRFEGVDLDCADGTDDGMGLAQRLFERGQLNFGGGVLEGRGVARDNDDSAPRLQETQGQAGHHPSRRLMGFGIGAGRESPAQRKQDGRRRSEHDQARDHIDCFAIAHEEAKGERSGAREASKLEARLGEHYVGDGGDRQLGADLFPKRRGQRLARAAVPHPQAAFEHVDCRVPTGIDGRAQKDVPVRVQSPAPAHDIAVAQEDDLALGFDGRIGADEIADVEIAAQAGPIGGGPFGDIGRAEEELDGAQFIGQGPEIIRPTGRTHGAPLGTRHQPRKLVPLVPRPEPQRKVNFLQIIDAGDFLGLRLAPRQGRQKQARQNGNDRDDHQAARSR